MRALIIDDDEEVAEAVGLTFGITWPDSETISASSGDSGIYMAGSEWPSLVILEVDLPDMDGFTICKEIRRFSDVPIIMLTERSKEGDIVRGLQVGADDYIIKPLRGLVFMAKVKAVLRRAEPAPAVVDSQVFESGNLKVDFAAAAVFLGKQRISLTPTEYRLLCQLLKSAGKVVPSRTLLGQIWGRDYLDETRYLKVHIKHLRNKLGDDLSAPKYIFTERKVGYGFVNSTTQANDQSRHPLLSPDRS